MLMITQKITLGEMLENLDKCAEASNVPAVGKLAYSLADGKEQYGLSDDSEYVRKGLVPSDLEFAVGAREVTSYITTLEKDRDDEVVLPEGARLKEYRGNPVVPFCHNYYELPVGSNIWIKPDSKKSPSALVARTRYANHDKANDIYNYRRDGFPLAESIGFAPLKWTSEGDDGWDEALADWRTRYGNYALSNWRKAFRAAGEPFRKADLEKLEVEGLKMLLLDKLGDSADGAKELAELLKGRIPKDKDNPLRIYTDWVLYEYSDVVVPSNPRAVSIAVSKGLLTDEAAARFAGDVHGDEGITNVGFDSTDEGKLLNIFVSAPITTPTIDDFAATGFHPAEKTVIPYRDLGKAPEDTDWDAAAERSGAEVDDLKLMCTWYDSENADVKSSYKLPHHKATGGHVAVWRAVAAAMAALMGARGGVNIPDSDRKGVFNHLARHYKQWDKEPPEFKDYPEEPSDVKVWADVQYDEDGKVKGWVGKSEWRDTIDGLLRAERDEAEANLGVLPPEIIGLGREHPEDALVKFGEILRAKNEEIEQLKEGRVLSEASRKRVKKAADSCKAAYDDLMAIYDATEPLQEDDIDLESVDMKEVLAALGKGAETDITVDEARELIRNICVKTDDDTQDIDDTDTEDDTDDALDGIPPPEVVRQLLRGKIL